LGHRARVDEGAGPLLGTLLRQITAGAAKKTMLVRGDELARVVRRAGAGFTPSASPSIVIAGTVMGGCAARAASIAA
jgi:hypothetical protein